MNKVRRTAFGWRWWMPRALLGIAASVFLVTALALPTGAHSGSAAHLWSGHIKLMAEAGTINASDNPVHWTKLKGVPGGLADGVDDGDELPGFGLKKDPNVFGGKTFSVNTTQIQRRVAGGCGPDRAIREITESGAIDCDPLNQALSKTITDTGQICNGLCTEGALALPVGTWAIFAEIEVEQQEFDTSLHVECELHAAGLVDATDFAGKITRTRVGVQLLATFAEPANTSVNCRDFDVGDVRGGRLSIIAMRMGG